MIIEKKLEEMGITLHTSDAGNGAFVPVRQLGNALFVSGQLPMADGKLYTGKVGKEHDIEYAQEAVAKSTINLLCALKSYLGDLDKIKKCIKLQIYIASDEGFDKQHIVANAASEIIYKAFGENGRHARVAMGTNQLPMNVTAEVEGIFEI